MDTSSSPWIEWKAQIADILAELKTVEGNFAVGGQLKDAPFTTISVEGVGKIPLPIYEEKAASLIKVCEQAPFGRKTETIVDTSVRNSWQLSPAAFKVLNSQWEPYLSETVLPLVCNGLGIQTPIKSTLYKLLLYQPGSFFKRHRDSEKEDRMFGTLVIQLPSEYEGGQLVVSQEMEKEEFDFSSNEPGMGKEFSVFFSAFYCDCEHEVFPVTSGYRLCLVYNLISSGHDSVPIAPALHDTKMKIITLLKNWPATKPQKVVYVLSHQYTKAGLSFGNLKGCDQTIARLLTAAVKECSVILHLALLLRHETGGADYDAEYDQDDVKVYDLESDYSLSNWISPHESKKKIGKFAVDKLEIIPEDCFQDMLPDKEQFTEHTGNEGATVDRWYHRAAVVMWPKGNWEMVECPKVPCKILFETFIDFLKVSYPYPESSKLLDSEFTLCFSWDVDRQYCTRWQRTIAVGDEDGCEEPALQDDEKSYKAFSIIAGFNNLPILQKFIELYYEFNTTTLPLLLQQCDHFGWENLYPQLKIVLQRGKEPMKILLQFINCKKLVDGEKKEVCEKLFNDLLYGRLTARVYYHICYYDKGSEAMQREFFESTFDVSITGGFDPTEFLKSTSSRYRVHVAAPALCNIVNKSSAMRFDSLWKKLTDICVDDLEKDVAKKMDAPSSWRQSTDISCSKGDCSCLRSFLLMDREETTLNVAKNRRSHIQLHLDHLKNVTFQTKANGNRFDIEVRKNRSEFEKNLEKYNHAKALLVILRPDTTTVSNSASPDGQPSKKIPKLDDGGTETKTS